MLYFSISLITHISQTSLIAIIVGRSEDAQCSAISPYAYFLFLGEPVGLTTPTAAKNGFKDDHLY